MTYVRTVKCRCNADIYMGSNHIICPKCKKEIYLKDDEPYMKDTDTPILNTYKFHPATLKYFQSEYPKDGEKILNIYSDNYSEIFYWEDRFIQDYEEQYINKKEPINFSWKTLDR